MGLQVRLRHALGERFVELPDRDVSQPWVIGRGSEADLTVPSVGVAPQHAALFVHEGRWVVQGYGGTITLNGEPLEMAAGLRVGDVVGLGSEAHPPTLEIDPVGAAQGRRGPVKAAPPNAGRPGFVRPAQPIGSDEAFSPATDEDTIEWDPQTPTPTTTEFYVPKGRQTPVAGIVAAVTVGVAVLVGASVVAYQRMRQPPVVVVAPSPHTQGTTADAPKAKLFDLDADQAGARQARSVEPRAELPVGEKVRVSPGSASPADSDSGRISATPTASVTSAVASPLRGADDSAGASERQALGTPNEDPPDPDDPEWHEIEQAHFNVRHQGVAIIKYDEYRRAHPGKYTSWLDQYTEEAVNWLYWQRVAQLCKQRDDLTAEVNQKKIDLRNQPTGQFHEQLVKDKADLEARLADAAKKLTGDMGYAADAPPDLEKPGELRQLSAKRNAAKYAEFKRSVLRYVRDHHGSVWWEGD